MGQQVAKRSPSQISHRLNSTFREFLTRQFAYTGQTSNRQRKQKSIYVIRLDNE